MIVKTHQKTDLLDYCYMQAFRSNPIVDNLLRVLINSTEPLEKTLAEVEEIIEETIKREKTRESHFYPRDKIYIAKQSINKHSKAFLEFFCGKFGEVLKDYIKTYPSLGWSSSYMKELIPLYIFLVLPNDDLPESLKTVLERTGSEISSNLYSIGLPKDKRTHSDIELLEEWKTLFPVSKELKLEILDVLNSVMIDRVDAIMQNNRRNYYSECALFINIIGLAREAVDPKLHLKDYLQNFIDRYPRRRNFVRDLRDYMNEI